MGFMLDQATAALKRPELWQRSATSLWDDPHISKGMLKAHLDPEIDAASRRHETIDRSVKWLSGMIPQGGRILDLGCGPGLYTMRLAALGYQVTGIDYAKGSIDYAKQHDPKTDYRYQNYLELDEEPTYDAITLIYCDYAALTPAERACLLPRIYRALKPGGRFLLDVFSRAHFKNRAERTGWHVGEKGGYWSKKPYICLEASYQYEDHRYFLDQYVVITQDAVTAYRVWDTAYTREELMGEITPFGFRCVGVFGDVCGAPYQENSDTICAVLEKA